MSKNPTPPHLIDEEDENHVLSENKKFGKIGAQGPSKYGPGGSRRYKAIGNKGRNEGKK